MGIFKPIYPLVCFLVAIFPLIWPAIVLLIVVVGLVGVLYSLLMSRWLVRRFKRAESWSKGDFARIANDNSGDELGLQEFSSLIHQLRPIELAEKSFAETLREYCERWSRQQNIALDLNIEEVSLLLEAEEALFRVVQEALK